MDPLDFMDTLGLVESVVQLEHLDLRGPQAHLEDLLDHQGYLDHLGVPLDLLGLLEYVAIKEYQDHLDLRVPLGHLDCLGLKEPLAYLEDHLGHLDHLDHKDHLEGPLDHLDHKEHLDQQVPLENEELLDILEHLALLVI